MATDEEKQAQRVREQVSERAKLGEVTTGGGTIFSESILVVNQKAKLIEVTNEYKVFDANGAQIGAVHEIGQSAGKKIARALLNVDAFMKHELQIVDSTGTVQLSLVKPRALLKAQLQVNGSAGQLIGSIAVKLRLGKAKFNLFDASGAEIGTMNAENFRAWNFSIADASGTEVAKVTKTWEGLGKAMFTNADNYVLQILSPLSDPLHSLVVASALGIDLILKQAKG